jgi:DNA-binding CsgD family transcriptional regulator
MIGSLDVGKGASHGECDGRFEDRAMVSIDEFSRLAAGIYRSAICADEWAPSIDAVRRAVDATGGGLSFAQGSTRRMINVNVPAEAMASYGAHYQHIDYVLAEVEAGPVGTVRTGSELVALGKDSEFDADWMRPYGMDDGVFVRLSDDVLPTSLILAAPQRSRGFDTPERVQLVTALVPHLQQALRTRGRVRGLVDDRDDLASAVDTVAHGVVVIGPNGRATHVNRAADRICRSGDGLDVHNGSLRAAHGSVDSALQQRIRCAFARDGLDPWGGSLSCPRPSGLRPYVVHVMPADRTADSDSARRVIVAIVDPESEPEPSASLLQRIWGLTAAEADVAVRIARGAEPKAIADEASVSITTVRTHLQRVYDKTGTHRQAELVRLVLTVRS